MKTKIILLFGIVAFLILQSGCDKEVLTKQNSKKPFENFFVENSVSFQEFTRNSAYDSFVWTEGYTKITIPAHSFVDHQGQPINGQYILRVKEMSDKKDMILSGIFSVSQGKPLVSAGEIYIEAQQGDEILKLSPGKHLEIDILCDDIIPVTKYQSFYGIHLTKETDWGIPQDSIQLITGASPFNPSTSYFYHCELLSLDFFNCDYYLNSGGPIARPKARLMGSQFNEDNTLVFITIDNLNSASTLHSNGGGAFSAGTNYELPVGMAVTYAAISLIDGQYYSTIQSSTIANGCIEELNLMPTSLTAFKLALEDLP
jgi:hypothetical protein